MSVSFFRLDICFNSVVPSPKISMKRLFVVVVVLLCGIATSFAENRERLIAQTDSLVHSRRWSFRPVTMQNPDSGTTRDIYAYNFFFNMDSSYVTVSMPVEWVNMSIFTEEFTAQVDNYSASFVDGDYWRILFTVYSKSGNWAVELAVEPTTGRVNMAIVAQQGVMRYVGAFYVLKNERK